MSLEESHELQYTDFEYSMNATKLLQIKNDDLNILLKKFNVTPENLDDMVQNIKEWYKKQLHLPQRQLHDRMIIGQLITRGLSIQQAKKNIDNYFTARHRMPELLGNWQLSENAVEYLKDGSWIILPRRTPANHRIVIFRILNPKINIFDVVRLSFPLADYRLFNDTMEGDHWIFDLNHANLNQALQFNPLMISKIYHYFSSCYGIKVKGIHLVNVPSFGQSILMFIKSIMKDKLVARLHLYQGFEDIYNVLPKELFPKDLGGTFNLTCQDIADLWFDTLKSKTWSNFYEHQVKTFLTDESKRTSDTNASDIFGVEGTFRKLDLD